MSENIIFIAFIASLIFLVVLYLAWKLERLREEIRASDSVLLNIYRELQKLNRSRRS